MEKKYSDEEILRGIAEGDDKVILHCMKRIYPPIKNLVKDESRIQDLIQEGLKRFFILVVQEKPKKEFHSPIGYLYIICRNIFLEEKKNYTFTMSIDGEEYIDIQADEVSPTMRIRRTIFNKALEEALGDISQQCFKILTLYFFENLERKEIAQRIGLKYKNTVYHFEKCIKKLRKILLKYLPDLDIDDIHNFN